MWKQRSQSLNLLKLVTFSSGTQYVSSAGATEFVEKITSLSVVCNHSVKRYVMVEMHIWRAAE